MIRNVFDHLDSVTIGVRFRSNFSIEDQFGNILDEILYSKDSFFSPTMFPAVHSNVNEKILYNPDTMNTITINASNIIVDLKTLEDKGKYLSNFHEHFKKDIINGIMKKYKITQIIRIGYINRFLFEREKLAQIFLDKTIGKTLEGIRDINLRFSRKFPIEESYVHEEINDYYTAIYNIIKKGNEDNLLIFLDFQRNYEPFLEASSQIEFDRFIEKMVSYNSKSFLEWINNNYGELNEVA